MNWVTVANQSAEGRDRHRRVDYAAGNAYRAALTNYAEGTAWFGVSAVPAVIFDEKI